MENIKLTKTYIIYRSYYRKESCRKIYKIDFENVVNQSLFFVLYENPDHEKERLSKLPLFKKLFNSYNSIMISIGTIHDNYITLMSNNYFTSNPNKNHKVNFSQCIPFKINTSKQNVSSDCFEDINKLIHNINPNLY